MPQQIEFDGTIHDFPDDFTQDDIRNALSTYTAPKPVSPVYTRENPAPGVSLAPNAQLEAMMYDVPPEQYGNQKKAEIAMQEAQTPMSNINPQYLDAPTTIPIPTNMDALALTGQGIGKGAADLAGMFGDIPMMVINGISGLADIPIEAAGFAPTMKLTGPTASDTISNIFGDVAQSAGYPVQDPNQLEGSDRYNYNAARFGSSGAVGGAASAFQASRLANAGQELGMFTKAYGGNNAQKARQVLDDTIMGIGSGVGSTSVEDSDSPLAQFTGTIAGGALASTGSRVAESMATKPFRAVETRLPVKLPNGTTESKQTVRDSAKLIQTLATNPQKASAKIKEMNALAGETGMTKPTTGMAADDVGLGAVEVGNRTTDPRAYMERDQAIKTDVSKSVNDMVDKNADITAPQLLARKEADRLKQEAVAASDVAQSKLSQKELEKQALQNEMSDTVQPVLAERGNKAEASTKLDEQFTAAKEERGAAVNEEYSAAYKGKTVDVKPIRKSIEKINNSINELGFENTGVPKEFDQKIKSLIDNKDGMVDAEDLGKIRGRISVAADKATKAGNTDLADNLKTLKADITKTLDTQIPESKIANKNYAENYAPFFKEGTGGKVAGMKRKATDSAPYKSSDTARFFLDGTPESASDLKKIIDIAPSPADAEGAVQQYLTADLAHKLGNNPSPRSVANWLKDNSAQLDQFPAIKDKFVKLQKTMGSQAGKSDVMKIEIDRLHNEFKRAEGDILKTERRVNKGVLGTLINNDPDRYVKNIMSGDDRLQKLDEVNKLIGNNKQAKDGLKRAVTEHILDTVTGTNVKAVDNAEGPIVYNQIAKVMKSNEDALAKVYSPSEMSTLRRAQKILGSYGNLERRSLSGSDTVQKAKTEGMVAGLTAFLRYKVGVLRAGGLMKTIKDAAALLPDGRIAKAERLVSQAMFDPELASHLLDTKVKDYGTVGWNKRLNQLLAVGAAARENVDNKTPTGEDEK